MEGSRGTARAGAPFESLDFIYCPSADVARDLAFYRDVLGGKIVWGIERFDTRVAEVRLAAEAPHVLLAEHLSGEAPVFMYRVADLEAAIAALRERGIEVEAEFGIPPGEAAELSTPGGQRIAIYERTRDVFERFPGRVDFEVPAIEP